MGIERIPGQTERVTCRQILLLLLYHLDFEWVAKWQTAKVGIFPTLISNQPSFKDNLMTRIVMLHVNWPPEGGHPPKVAARLKKPAFGMNDAPRRWWNILDKALRLYGMVPTRAGYSVQSRGRAWEHWGQRAIAQQNGTTDAFTDSREQVEAAFEKKKKTLDPHTWKSSNRKSVAGIINLFVDDLFGTGGNEMGQRVLTRLRKIFPSWFRRLQRCSLYRTENSLDTRFPKRAAH